MTEEVFFPTFRISLIFKINDQRKEQKQDPISPLQQCSKSRLQLEDCTVVCNKKFRIIPTVFLQADLIKHSTQYNS